jgi:capsule polysaccharide modification protein KpsS
MRASPSNESIESMDSAQPGMNAAQQFVVVKAPLERVYEQWSRIIRSMFDPYNLSRRVQEYLGNFKRLVERAEGRE